MTVQPGFGVAALAISAARSDPSSPLRTDKNAVITCLAIGYGESSWNDQAVGDRNIAGERTPDGRTWEKSRGIWQVRCIEEERGTGATRDPIANMNPRHNAAAMVTISNGGRDWGAWSTFTQTDSPRYYRNFWDRAVRAMEDFEARIGPLDELDDSYGLLPDLALGVDDNIVQPVAGALDPIAGAVAFFTDRSLWLRIGLAVAGFVLFLVAVAILAGESMSKAIPTVRSLKPTTGGTNG